MTYNIFKVFGHTGVIALNNLDRTETIRGRQPRYITDLCVESELQRFTNKKVKAAESGATPRRLHPGRARQRANFEGSFSHSFTLVKLALRNVCAGCSRQHMELWSETTKQPQLSSPSGGAVFYQNNDRISQILGFVENFFLSAVGQ
jgi:hypothetical protein